MRFRDRAGFTLIELMIVVVILGVLAAVGLPALAQYIKPARAAEAYENIKQIFNQAATYYIRERASSEISGGVLVHCTVGSADNHVTPNATKQEGHYGDEPFRQIGFVAGHSYYRYEIQTESAAGPRCGVEPNTAPIYRIRGVGDMDGDGERSLFELATGSNGDNEMYHARGFFVDRETE